MPPLFGIVLGREFKEVVFHFDGLIICGGEWQWLSRERMHVM